MIVGDAITHLLSYTDVTDKIEKRIYARRAPNKAVVPYVLVSRISGDPVYDLTQEIGKAVSLLQFTTWARDPNGSFVADEVAALLRDKLSGYRGYWGDTYVNGCTLESEPIELEEAPGDSSDLWWFGVDQTYRVTHSTPVPTLS